MEDINKRRLTKEIRILADTPPSRDLIPKYKEALDYLGDVPDVEQDTITLDQQALKALIQEKNIIKAMTIEDKIEYRRKKELKTKLKTKMDIASTMKEDE